ncbi:MAG: hypothetical protein ACSHWN_00010 [Methylophilaceae bacterium]
MPILVDDLSVWDISFRWAGYDPRKLYFRIPVEVEDIARTLIHAIHKAELASNTIMLEKKPFDKDIEKYSFYYWADDFFSTTSGRFVSRKLLKWTTISRYSFMDWCERMNAPLPAFWFPEGWNLEYALRDGELKPGYRFRMNSWSEERRDAYWEEFDRDEFDDKQSPEIKLRKSQQAKIACRQVAEYIWKQDSTRTIASIIDDNLIQDYCGANYYDNATVRGWINDLAPDEIRSHRGRPRKNKD